MDIKTKMNAKKLMVSLFVFASILLFATQVSAVNGLAKIDYIKVDGVVTDFDTTGGIVNTSRDVSVVAGESIPVKVVFEAKKNDTDVDLEVEIEGEKVDSKARTTVFDVEDGKTYSKTLVLEVPYELKDQVSDDIELNIEIDGKEYKTEATTYLRVQRKSYNAEIKSVSAARTVQAGDNFPVDIVLKNRGYNDLDDLYVTAEISALGIKKTGYFGDLVAVEEDTNCCDEDEDTVMGRIYLDVPYDVNKGVYTLEVSVENEDTTSNVVKQLSVEKSVSSNVISNTKSKSVDSGEDAEYNLLLVNPTDRLKVYEIVTESSKDLSTSSTSSVVAIPAGSSKNIGITANAVEEGDYDFNVEVFSNDELEESVTLNAKVTDTVKANPIVILTVVLVIIFIVLLVVLVVLLSKKPNKEAEDFGESYY